MTMSPLGPPFAPELKLGVFWSMSICLLSVWGVLVYIYSDKNSHPRQDRRGPVGKNDTSPSWVIVTEPTGNSDWDVH